MCFQTEEQDEGAEDDDDADDGKALEDSACAPKKKDATGTKVKKSSKGKEKDDTEITMMVDISKSMSTISSAASQLANVESGSKKPVVDSHELWAQLLAVKLRSLKKKEAETFKNKVDGMLLDLLPEDSD